jgi:hypothetical protein
MKSPRAVRFACSLLVLQGCLWALVSLAALAVSADRANWAPAAQAGHVRLAWYLAASVGAVAAAAGLSILSFALAFRLERRKSRARAGAVVLETGMASFGLLVAYAAATAGAGLPALLPVSAGLAGAALSAAAAAMLLGRAAAAFVAGA